MKTSVAGVYSVSLRSSGAGRSIVKETPSITADTWTKVVLTFVGDSNVSWRSLGNGDGCIFEINLGRSNTKNTSTLDVHQSGNKVASNNQVRWIGTNSATFFLTGLQIEEGTSATEFEHRSIGEELALCQRYYYQMEHNTARRFGVDGLYSNGTGAGLNIMFTHPVPMRAAPTVTPGSAMGGTTSFSNTENHIYMSTTGHSTGRVGVETSSGTTTVAAEL